MADDLVFLRYSRTKLRVAAVLFAVAGSMASGTLVMALLGFALLGFAVMLAWRSWAQDDRALIRSGDALVVRTLWGRTRIALGQYRSIGLERTRAFGGLVPIPGATNLVIRYGDGLLGTRRVRLPFALLDYAERGVPFTADALEVLTRMARAQDHSESPAPHRAGRRDPLEGVRGRADAPPASRRRMQ